MKKFVLALALFSLAAAGWSQNLVIAVVPFEAKSGYSSDDLEIITDLFSSCLVQAGGIDVVTRSQFEAILKEARFQRTGLTSDSDYARLGAALNAKAVVTGSLMKLGSRNYFSVSIIDVESAKVLSSSRTEFRNIDEVVDKMPALAKDLTRSVSNANELVGAWFAENSGSSPWILTFNSDGTFSISEYRKQTMLYRKSTVNPKVAGEAFYTEISGEVKGTYSHTKEAFTLTYTIKKKKKTWIEQMGYNPQMRTNSYSDQGVVTVHYELSNNGRELKIRNNSFFKHIEHDLRWNSTGALNESYISVFKR